MKDNSTTTTVLQKCGLTNETVNALIKRGLFIPLVMQKSEKIISSPNQAWFQYAADQFTPPLSKEELERYIENPEDFSTDLINSLKFFTEISGILYSSAKQLEELKDAERASAALAILRVFQSSMDYLYYKFDRHFDYHDNEDSPVGYYWIKLQKLCQIAANNLGVEHPERWSKERFLAIISFPRGEFTMSAAYTIECEKTINLIEKKIGDMTGVSVETLIQKLKSELPDDYETIVRKGGLFNRLTNEFLTDCLAAKNLRTSERLEKTRIVSQKAYDEVVIGLKDKSVIREFKKVVNAISNLVRVQEEETFIFYGLTPQGESHVLDVGFLALDYLLKAVRSNNNLVIEAKRKMLLDCLEPEGPPSRIVAARKVVYELDSIFAENVKKLYSNEIKRWV